MPVRTPTPDAVVSPLQYAVAWNCSRAPACGRMLVSTIDVAVASEHGHPHGAVQNDEDVVEVACEVDLLERDGKRSRVERDVAREERVARQCGVREGLIPQQHVRKLQRSLTFAPNPA